MAPRITLIHGKAGSGKNWYARKLSGELNAQGHKCLEVAFADHLKADLAGRGVLSLDEAVAKEKTSTIRLALTKAGQECRAINERYFSAALLAAMRLYEDQGIDHFIVTDLRFRSELFHILEVCPEARLISINAPKRTFDRYLRESRGDASLFDLISKNVSETDLDDYVAHSGRFEIIDNDPPR